MKNRLHASVVVLCLAAGSILAAGQLRPQLLGVNPYPNADPFFDDSVLQEIRLVVNTDDWQSLKDHYLENTYYPADFTWRNVTVRNAGIRSRGTGSRSPIKPGLGVAFDKYVTNQKFLGLSEVVLRNNTQDPSNMHERLTMQLFGRLGLPASREAYATMYLNNEYVGLYTIVESIDEAFLKRTLGEDSGYLYEFDYPDGASPYFFEYRGADPDLYVPLPFKPQNHKSDPKGEFIEQFVWTANETGDAAFRTAIGEYLDVSQFLKHIAVDAYVADNDGFLGDWGMNNLYLYRVDGTKRFAFLTWDKSEAFKPGFTYPILPNIAGAPPDRRNRLMTRLVSFGDLRDQYLDALVQCQRSADDPEGGASTDPGWLEREIQRQYLQIREAALADPVKPFSNDEFERAVNDLGVFARHRGRYVAAEVNRARTRPLPLSTAARRNGTRIR